MDIYVPRYEELYIRDGEIALHTSMKGEYRAYLRGPDGRLKSDTGWKPNTLLNMGLQNMVGRTGDIAKLDGSMALGDSDTAVDITQTSLQGNFLGYQTITPLYVSVVNNGSPNYEIVTVIKATFVSGVQTGTVKEFILQPEGASYTVNANIRCVLDTPIVKGAQDELTIEHRLTTYPDVGDATGTIDISGVDYTYTLRRVEIDATPGGGTTHPDNTYWHSWSNNCYTDNITTNLLGGPSVYTTGPTDRAVVTNSSGGSLGTYYMNGIITAGVDNWVGDIRSVKIYNQGLHSTYQFQIGKVSDDSPLTKANTHELVLNIRVYPQRYVP